MQRCQVYIQSKRFDFNFENHYTLILQFPPKMFSHITKVGYLAVYAIFL